MLPLLLRLLLFLLLIPHGVVAHVVVVEIEVVVLVVVVVVVVYPTPVNTSMLVLLLTLAFWVLLLGAPTYTGICQISMPNS